MAGLCAESCKRPRCYIFANDTCSRFNLVLTLLILNFPTLPLIQ